MLSHCFRQGCLYLPVFYENDRPIGAIANLIDHRQKAMLFLMAGRDQTFSKVPSGLILHAEAIRFAIEHGFKTYDFLRGNEDYKYSFGVAERQLRHFVIRRKDETAKALGLDPRATGLVLQEADEYRRAHNLSKAERCYQHILQTQSHHQEALAGLATIMIQKGEYQTAESLFQKILATQPDSLQAWFGLGNLYQKQHRFELATTAYQQILAQQPNLSAVWNNLGYVHQQQEQWEEAISCYRQALEIQPNLTVAKVNIANTLFAQGKLPTEQHHYFAQQNHRLGQQCQSLGEWEAAIAYYRQATEMSPDWEEAQFTLERVMEMQNN
jgi:tetratricopeptide (TPR) repeat protein